MKVQLLENYFKDLGHQIENQSNANINGIDFEMLTIDPQETKQYIKIIEKIESNDVYSPKGDINRKVDEITRLMRETSSSINFAVAVPNEFLYHRILKEKLISTRSNQISGYLIGDSSTDIQVLEYNK